MTSAPRLAFLILAHADPQHLGRLVRVLQPVGDVYVHIDRKADADPFHAAAAGSDACFVQERVSVRWGGVSVVRATLQLIEASLHHRTRYTHLVLLSGACYPTRPVEQLRSHLAERVGRCLIRQADVSGGGCAARYRLDRFWFFESLGIEGRWSLPRQQLVRTLRAGAHMASSWLRRPLPASLHGCRFVFGSQWWALTPQCAAFLVEEHPLRHKLLRFLKFSLAPDEIYFHTLLANSPFAGTTTEPEAFTNVGVAGLANLHLIDPHLSKVHDLASFDAIANSGSFLARKFNSQISGALLARIDRELLSSDNPSKLGRGYEMGGTYG